jgi:Na+-translocating ferredoxin:NAD+ oxidoreductase subunit D
MNKLINVSPSPHSYGNDSVKKVMYGVVLAMIPAMLVSIFYFGISALILTAVAIASALFFEFAIQKYIMKVKPTVTDGSAIITGMLLAFNLPSNLPIHLIILGSFVAIAIGKMSFGGLGQNPFNPALVGRVFLLISFPVEMTSWPKPMVNRMALVDAETGATPLAMVKEGLKNNESLSSIMDRLPEYSEMFLGNLGGSAGEVSALAILVGFVWMIYRKIITWHIPVFMLGSMAALSGILWLVNPEGFADPVFHLITGGAMLGAVFMATDMVTSPMSVKGQIIFAVGIGVLTIVIRVFGAYPEGVSFAILIMNAFVPLLNTYLKPKRFGEIPKAV